MRQAHCFGVNARRGKGHAVGGAVDQICDLGKTVEKFATADIPVAINDQVSWPAPEIGGLGAFQTEQKGFSK